MLEKTSQNILSKWNTYVLYSMPFSSVSFFMIWFRVQIRLQFMVKIIYPFWIYITQSWRQQWWKRGKVQVQRLHLACNIQVLGKLSIHTNRFDFVCSPVAVCCCSNLITSFNCSNFFFCFFQRFPDDYFIQIETLNCIIEHLFWINFMQLCFLMMLLFACNRIVSA